MNVYEHGPIEAGIRKNVICYRVLRTLCNVLYGSKLRFPDAPEAEMCVNLQGCIATFKFIYKSTI
jgi:hypothetical protein